MGFRAAIAIVALFLASSTVSIFAAEPTLCEKAQAELAAANACADKEQAEQAYRSITAYYSGCHPQAAEAQLHIGEIFQNRKMCTDAAAAYEAVVAGFKDQTDLCIAALGKMGRTYKAANKLNYALASFKRIADGYPSRPAACADAMLSRAEIFEEAGNYRKAEAECRKLLQRYNTNPLLKGQCRTAHYRIPCQMKVSGRLDEALVAFAGIKPDPDDSYAATALLKRGEIFAAQQKHDEAIEEFQTTIDNHPQHKNTCLQAQFLMADSLLAKSDNGGVRRIAEAISRGAAIQAYPHLYYDLMSLQFRCGDAGWHVSAQKYTEIMSKSSDRARRDFPALEIAFYYERDIARATQLAHDFLLKYPSHALAPEAEYISGNCLMLSGDVSGALSTFDDVAARYEQLPDARLYVGASLRAAARILADGGRLREALSRLERIPAVKPGEQAAKLDKIGILHLGAGYWREAARSFKQESTIVGVPASVTYHALYHLADCYRRMGDLGATHSCLSSIIGGSADAQLVRKALSMLESIVDENGTSRW